MQIETYKTPYDNSGKVAASKWISYVLRPAETGCICPTALMVDPVFEQSIADLRAKQIADFHATRSPASIEMWRNRVIPEDGLEMTPKELKTLERQRQQRNRILAQDENVNDAGSVGYIRNLDAPARMQQLVHDLMLTQKYNLTSGLCAGKMIQHQFDKVILQGDVVANVSKAMIAIRDCFPPNMPVVLSFHLGQPKKDPATGRVLKDENGENIYENPHAHGWLADRLWDYESAEWGDISPLTSTVQGLSELRKKMDAAVLQATGTIFGDQAKKLDPGRPKRDVFTKRQAYWTKQFHGRQDEFLSGAFLAEITNKHEKEAMRQFIEQRKYDVAKIRKAEQLTQEKAEHRNELALLMKTNKVARHERKATFQDVEEMTMLIDNANNPSLEMKKMYPGVAATDTGKSKSFSPIVGYYRTKQYHKKLSANITAMYDGYSAAAKAEEIKLIRASITKIDKQLMSNRLTDEQRMNLEFTRDFEIKSLKYMKAALPAAVPVGPVAAAPVAVSTETKPELDTQVIDPNKNLRK